MIKITGYDIEISFNERLLFDYEKEVSNRKELDEARAELREKHGKKIHLRYKEYDKIKINIKT